MQDFNEWFISLPEGRQAVLREEKWMLADNAFQAGLAQGQAEIESLKAEKEQLRTLLLQSIGWAK